MDYALAIDIGGTNTEVAVISRDGKIIGRDRIPTDVCGADVNQYMQRLALCADNLVGSLALRGLVSGIGVVAPCVNSSRGVIEAATNLPWPSPIPLRDLLRAHTGLPVTAVNDANAAAAGERKYGATQGKDNFIMITLGTGVGGGVVCDGHLLNGRQGFAAELGHIRVRDGEGRRCSCRRDDCLETYCSARGAVETARRVLASGQYPGSELHRIPAGELTAADIGHAADRGDAAAREVWRRFGQTLGDACADFAAFSDPEAFVFFGGVSKAFRHFSKSLKETYDRNALHLYAGRVGMLPSGLPSADAALLGAAALAFGD